jgi:hypothetical protein
MPVAPPVTTASAWRFPWPAALLLILPPAVYLWVLVTHSVNAPISDDYFAILDFLLRWQEAGNKNWTNLLFEQFYSHRIPFNHLLAAGLTGIFGHCDLRVFHGVAIAGWILLLLSLARLRGTTSAGLFAMVPISLLLMQPQGHSNLLVATGSPGHSWCLLCAFWSLQLAARSMPIAMAGAILLAVTAALCSSNGLLLFPVIVLMRLLARQWHGAGLWLVVGAAIWLWYLAGYSLSAQPIATHAFSLVKLALNTTTMIGAVMMFGRLDSHVAVPAGLLVIVGALIVTWQEHRRSKLDANSGLILFLLSSVLLTAWARVGWGQDYMLQDRYRPYGLLLLALLYFKILDRLPAARQRWFTAGLIPPTAIFCLLSYGQTLADLKFNRNWAEATIMNLALDRAVPLAAAPDLSARAGLVLDKAVAQGLIRPPHLLTAAAAQQLKAGLPATTSAEVSAWEASWSASMAGYKLATVSAASCADQPMPSFGVFNQGAQPLILPVVPLRARVAEVLGGRRLLGARYEFAIPGNHCTPGPALLHAIHRAVDGRISVLWSATVNLGDPPASGP